MQEVAYELQFERWVGGEHDLQVELKVRMVFQEAKQRVKCPGDDGVEEAEGMGSSPA